MDESTAGGRLRERLAAGAVVAPTAYDMLAARVVAEAGFEAVFCSGYGQAASGLGVPDVGGLDLDFIAARTAAMVASTDAVVLVDADDGWGDPAAAVRRLAAAGAGAVMIEDQIPAKRCGHVPGKQVIAADEMAERVAVAAAGRTHDLVLIARTDARDPLGFEEALRRGALYAQAGADMIFVEAPESEAELAAIPARIPVPSMANMLPDGRTPLVPVEQLEAMGFRLVVFGLLDMMLATAALRAGFRALRASGDASTVGPRLSFMELNRLTGLVDEATKPAG